MANSAALLSAQTGLSALLGGTVGISANTASGTAAKDGQTSDFSAILSDKTGLMASRAPKATLSLTAATPDTGDATDATATDDTPATSGKSLPLAALTAAVLPVPITLAAWVKGPGDQQAATATQDDGTQGDATQDDDNSSADPFADASTVNLDARNITLAAMMHGVFAASSPATPPTPLASAATDATIGTGADTALPRPGFALLGTDSAATALQPRLASTQGLATLQADTSVAMLDTSRIRGAGDGPGFTLLAKAQGDTQANVIPATISSNQTYPQPGFSLLADTAAAAPTTQPTVTLTPDMSIVMAPGATTGKTQLASAQTADDDTVTAAADVAKPLRLASARSAIATARPVAAAGQGSTQNDAQTAAGDDTASSSFHAPTTLSADGASMPDNAPSPLLHLASAGTANVAQSLAATGGAAILSSPTGQTGTTDMAALVDRLVEARAAARSGLGAQSVQATVSHADFGRVSLRFNQDDEGLSVSMTSRDPGFAPAAQAALAQAPSVAASGQSQSAGQQNGNQQNSGQPGQQWAQASLQSGTGGQSGSGGQTWNQGGQNGAPYSQPTAAQQNRAATLAGTSATGTSPRTRGGILA